MNAIVDQPSNKNFLSPTGFKFEIPNLPTFNYFVQSVKFPPFNLNQTNVIQTPFNRLITGGDHVTFGDLLVEFKIDEDLDSYFEVFDWMVGIGFPNNYGQYDAIAANGPTSGKGIMRDATLTILNSSMNPNLLINFVDVMPASLSMLDFDSKNTDIDYITATAVFKYREFSRTKL